MSDYNYIIYAEDLWLEAQLLERYHRNTASQGFWSWFGFWVDGTLFRFPW